MLQKKYKPLFGEPIFQVVENIFNYPNKTFHIRELARITNLSTTAVKSAIKKLNHYKIITIEETQITTNIKADLESDSYYFYKKILNLYKLERYGLIWNLKQASKPEAIVLFGSFAKGEDAENSDIDILIITNEKNIGLGKLIENFEKEFNRKISLHILQNIEKSSTEFKNAIANGIVLYGYIKVV